MKRAINGWADENEKWVQTAQALFIHSSAQGITTQSTMFRSMRYESSDATLRFERSAMARTRMRCSCMQNTRDTATVGTSDGRTSRPMPHTLLECTATQLGAVDNANTSAPND